MKERVDLKPEDIPNDSAILVVIDGAVYELETFEDQELMGFFDYLLDFDQVWIMENERNQDDNG